MKNSPRPHEVKATFVELHGLSVHKSDLGLNVLHGEWPFCQGHGLLRQIDGCQRAPRLRQQLRMAPQPTPDF